MPFDKPVLSAVRSFDKLRMNGVEGLRANGVKKNLGFIATP
jgi:hypothetical protein